MMVELQAESNKLRSLGLAAWIATTLLVGGCAAPTSMMDPFAGLREAKVRAQVERQASHDPFPAPADVGLK